MTRNAELENSNRLLTRELVELKRREMTLDEDASSFVALDCTSHLGVMSAAADGTVTKANDAFLRMLGYGREDLMEGRMHWRRLCHSAEVFERCLRDGSYPPTEMRLIAKGGENVRLLFAAERVSGRREVIGFAHLLTA